MKTVKKKVLMCEYCSSKSNDVGHDAVKWVCSRCVQKSMDGSLTIDFSNKTEDINE